MRGLLGSHLVCSHMCVVATASRRLSALHRQSAPTARLRSGQCTVLWSQLPKQRNATDDVARSYVRVVAFCGNVRAAPHSPVAFAGGWALRGRIGTFSVRLTLMCLATVYLLCL